ncbi:MAG: cupin domain-containing protein [Chloroflexota bacterium]
MKKVNLAEKLQKFSDYWSPHTVTTFNKHDVMLVKVKGEFVWHQHDDTDDFFLVLEGKLKISLPDDEEIILNPGELYIVPKDVQHRPYAEVETHLLLIEPSGTPNTGDAETAAPHKTI